MGELGIAGHQCRVAIWQTHGTLRPSAIPPLAQKLAGVETTTSTAHIFSNNECAASLHAHTSVLKVREPTALHLDAGVRQALVPAVRNER
jgi:hypothetical protein